MDPHGVIWTLADSWRAKGKEKHLRFIAAIMERMERADTAIVGARVALNKGHVMQTTYTVEEKE